MLKMKDCEVLYETGNGNPNNDSCYLAKEIPLNNELFYEENPIIMIHLFQYDEDEDDYIIRASVEYTYRLYFDSYKEIYEHLVNKCIQDGYRKRQKQHQKRRLCQQNLRF